MSYKYSCITFNLQLVNVKFTLKLCFDALCYFVCVCKSH